MCKELLIEICAMDAEGIKTAYDYSEMKDLEVEWNALQNGEDSPLIPLPTDKLLAARVGGKEIQGDTVEAVFQYLRENYGWKH